MGTTQQVLLFLSAVMLAMLPLAAANYDPSMFRTYFGCPTCDESACPPTEPGCELVKEPGICGCCHTCALSEGSPCGIYTNRCGTGLKCTPSPFSEEPLQDLFLGTGSCEKSQGEISKVCHPRRYDVIIISQVEKRVKMPS